jgi:hypothetical protein
MKFAVIPARNYLSTISRGFALPAFGEIAQSLDELKTCRLILQKLPALDLGIYGGNDDRTARNELILRRLALRCIQWAESKVDFRTVIKAPPQSTLVLRRDGSRVAEKSISTRCPFTTDGFGLASGDRMSLIQCSHRPAEAELIASWFSSLWNSLPPNPESKS